MKALADEIASKVCGRTFAVVGVGNRGRGDDAVGLLVIERLAPVAGERAIDAGETPENHLGPLAERAPELVIFVDAAELGEAPGTIRLTAVAKLAPRAECTHAPSLRLAAAWLAAHGIDSCLLAIQPAGTSPFAAPCPAVVQAAGQAAAAIEQVLRAEASRA